MINSIKGQWNDWKYGRNLIRKILSDVSREDLDKPFPRKELNSIRKQCEELLIMQADYLAGLRTKNMKFSEVIISNKSRETLLQGMEQLDKELEKLLSKCSENVVINWYGEEKNINEHISAMIGHEQMHLGQIIAFCYAIDIEIPKDIVDIMALDN